MNNFENQIERILRKEVSKPAKYEYSINNALLQRKKINSSKNFYKIAAITCCCILSITGVVAATYTVTKIWKEPQLVNSSESVNQTEGENTWHEAVNNKVIEKNLKDYLEILNINNSSVIIEKGNNLPESEEEFYLLRTNTDYNKGILLCTDLACQEILYFINNEFDENIMYDKISNDTALQKAKEILMPLNIWDDNYELHSSDTRNNIFILDFYRKNESKINNKYDSYSISFGVSNNKINVQRIINEKNNSYSNNPFTISKEDAINIVTAKEKEFSDIDFNITLCEKGIEKMNTNIYKLENNINIINSADNNIYKIDNVIRNVWIIKLEHKKDNYFLEYDSFENYKKYADTYYYVDVTTGEIIGGKYGTPNN